MVVSVGVRRSGGGWISLATGSVGIAVVRLKEAEDVLSLRRNLKPPSGSFRWAQGDVRHRRLQQLDDINPPEAIIE